MRRTPYILYFLLLVILLPSFSGYAQTHTPRYTPMTSKVGGYYEYLPEGYNSNGTALYPLIVYIHGNSERGSGDATDLMRIIGGGLPNVMSGPGFPTSFTVNGQAHRFIVISPQFGPRPNAIDVDSVLTYITNHYPIDLTRVYLTGFSMGGGACWDYAGTNTFLAGKIAAMVPVSGSGDPDTLKARNIAGANLPVWATHNSGDLSVPVSTTNTYVEFINTAPAPNPPAKKTIFNSDSHNAWSATYNPSFKENDLNVFEWMLQYQRPVAKKSNVIKVNLYGGINTYNITDWNNWNVSNILASGTLLYSDFVASNVTASLSKSTGISDNGTTYGSGMAPAQVLRYASNANSARTLTLRGLSPDKTYSLELYASRNSNSGYTTTFTIGAATQNISTYKNLTAKAVFTNLSANNLGQIIVNIQSPNAYNYLNGFTLWEEEDGNVNQPPVASAGSDQTITLPTNSITILGQGSDEDGTIENYSWSKISGPEGSSFGNSSAATTSVNNLAEGVYQFRLTVTDNDGTTAFDEVEVVVNAAPPPAGTRLVKVNLYGGTNAYDNAEWNNWNVVASLNAVTLKYADAGSSSISAELSQSNGVYDNGSTYGGTMGPAEVLRYTSSSGVQRTLTLTGLDNNKTYSIELYASRNSANGNSTVFTIAGVSQTIATYKNLTNKASFSNLAADESGKLIITIKDANTYNYLNGFLLTQTDTPPPPPAKSIKVNLYGGTNAYSNPEWNNWNVSSSLNSGELSYSDATLSSVTATFSKSTGINDNGSTYGGIMAPAEVLRYASNSNGARTLILSGLLLDKTYSLELYASRNANSGYTTAFTINGVAQSIATYRNKTNKAVFSNLVPGATGEVVINISSANAYNYFNGFILSEEAGEAPAKAAPSMRPDIQKLSVDGLRVEAFPNPTSQHFMLIIHSKDDGAISLRVLDILGRVVEMKNSVPVNTTLSLGNTYKPGVYYAELLQGRERRVVKLYKRE